MDNEKVGFDVIKRFLEGCKTVHELDEVMVTVTGFYRIRREHLEVVEANSKGLIVGYVKI